ncbi:MAG: protein kinase [Saccharolobus sp.]|uniref:protein kinase domain-containing protein n=1 Tax=Saccharolobus sp. TaxID=2100761 RepID=UPI0028CE7CB3|nr:protein kinase [Saccharolobus sp.]MDT7862152.1 protein kinase [Saccharolobus sp.]
MRRVKNAEAKAKIAKAGILVSIIIPFLGYLLYGIALGSLESIGYSTLAGILFTFSIYFPLFFPSIPYNVLFSSLAYLLGSVFLYKAYHDRRKVYAIIPISLSVIFLSYYLYQKIFTKILLLPPNLSDPLLIGFYEIGNLLQLLGWRNKRSSTFNVKIKVYGLPKKVPWTIVIDGNKYTFTSEIVKINVRYGESFYVDRVIINNDIYIPNPERGVINNDTLTIYFTKTINIPPINQWNPKIWIGRTIGEYRVIDVIGIGGNSYVLKVVKDNKVFAMKIPKVEKNNVGQTRVSVNNLILDLGKEFINLQEISSKSENVVKLYGISEINVENIIKIQKGDSLLYLNKPPYIVMEYMEGGTALDLLNNIQHSYNWYKIVAIIMMEVSKALEVIHNSGYVHLDVKPQNIYFNINPGKEEVEIIGNLIKGNVKIKLGDLGSAKKIGEKVDDFTEYYCPYEQIEAALLKNQGAQPTMDIFALGSTAYKLLYNSYVFPKEYYEAIEKAIEEYLRGGNFIQYLNIAKKYFIPLLPKTSNVPSWLLNLILQTLNPIPIQRPSATQIKETIRRNLFS